MSKSGRGSRQKKRTARRRTISQELPQDLPEAISWLRKLGVSILSMNIEGITRLKNQFDQIFDDHVIEFDRKLKTMNSETPNKVQECLDAQIILGHLLAICKYLERIGDVKLQSQRSLSKKRVSNSLSHSLQKELTKELRIFSNRLEQTQSFRPA